MTDGKEQSVEVWQRIEGTAKVTRVGEWLEIDLEDHCVRIRGLGSLPCLPGKAIQKQGPVPFGGISYDDEIEEAQVKKMGPGSTPPPPGPEEGWERWTESGPRPENVVATRMRLKSNPTVWVLGYPLQHELPPQCYVTEANGYFPGPLQNQYMPGGG